jgi:hypothetical protein
MSSSAISLMRFNCGFNVTPSVTSTRLAVPRCRAVSTEFSVTAVTETLVPKSPSTNCARIKGVNFLQTALDSMGIITNFLFRNRDRRKRCVTIIFSSYTAFFSSYLGGHRPRLLRIGGRMCGLWSMRIPTGRFRPVGAFHHTMVSISIRLTCHHTASRSAATSELQHLMIALSDSFPELL